jgi:hypothetical protein
MSELMSCFLSHSPNQSIEGCSNIDYSSLIQLKGFQEWGRAISSILLESIIDSVCLRERGSVGRVPLDDNYLEKMITAI